MTSNRFVFPTGERVSCRNGAFWTTFGRMEVGVISFGIQLDALTVHLYLDDKTKHSIVTDFPTFDKFSTWVRNNSSAS